MAGDSGVFDLYGFELSVSPAEKDARYSCAEYARRREAKWEPFVRSQSLPEGAKLKRYVRKGVPPALRGWVWWHTSGAAQHRARYGPSHFQDMVAAGEQRPSVKQIELDLPRTFPRNSWVPTPEGLAALRSVLVAYSAHNPDVGYCQGMNFLAALLLLAVEKDAERCFWLLVTLLEGVLYPKTYAPNLDGCHVEMRVLDDLLAKQAPKLHKHLQDVGCEPSLFATDWFLVLFATTLPAETAARVWDGVFLEGNKVLFRVALTLLIMNQGLLLKKDNAGELLKALKDACSHVHNRDKLMAAAYKGLGAFPRSKIRDLRVVRQREVDAMLSQRAASKRKGTLRDAISSAQALQVERPDDSAAAAAAPPAALASAGSAGSGAGLFGSGGGAAAGSSGGGAAAAAAAAASAAAGQAAAVAGQAGAAAAAAAGQAAAAAGQAGAAAAASLNRLYSSFKGGQQ